MYENAFWIPKVLSLDSKTYSEETRAQYNPPLLRPAVVSSSSSHTDEEGNDESRAFKSGVIRGEDREICSIIRVMMVFIYCDSALLFSPLFRMEINCTFFSPYWFGALNDFVSTTTAPFPAFERTREKERACEIHRRPKEKQNTRDTLRYA